MIRVVGRHTIVYGLAEAQLVAFEIAAATAAGIRPFGEKGEAEFVGNVVYIARTHTDLEHVDQRLTPWCHDRSHFKHRLELGQPDDLAGMVATYKPALVVRDLTQYSTPYQPNVGDERLLWLQGAKKFAVDHDCAVLTAISVEPHYSMIGIPGSPPRHRKLAQPWNLASFGDLHCLNDENMLLEGDGKLIALTRQPSEWDRRYFHLALRPRAELYTSQDYEPPDERVTPLPLLDGVRRVS